MRLLTSITAEYLRERLDYDPATGVFTWRAKPDQKGAVRRWNTRYAGRRAGTLKSIGYWYVGIDHVEYLAHRLAWLYVYGDWPSNELDHRYGVPSDTRIASLRLSDRSTNTANTKRRVDNSSGFKGVWKVRSGKFTSQLQKDGKVYCLGTFETAESAHAAYAAAAHKYHGEFARVA